MADVVVERLEVGVYDVPTEEPESDGTLEWEKTTVVTVEPVASDGTRALGFIYGTGACARLVSSRKSASPSRSSEDTGSSNHVTPSSSKRRAWRRASLRS